VSYLPFSVDIRHSEYIKAFIRLFLPRQSEENNPTRPLDIAASDVDVLVELKPEGKVSDNNLVFVIKILKSVFRISLFSLST
jgi:hypothetical protein